MDVVQALLDGLEGGEKVPVDLQAPPLDLAPQIPSGLQVVLLFNIVINCKAGNIHASMRNKEPFLRNFFVL